jgi:hypothetical protein
MRRKQIFDFIQYLKKEGLFEYLEMKVYFIDERVLAPGYKKFAREIRSTPFIKQEIEGQPGRTVEMPPMELRERISKELQKDIEKTSEDELLNNMYKIRKNELTYEGIRKSNTQYRVLIYSEGMIRERYPSSYSSGSENIKDHDDINNIIIDKSLAYMYINE